MFLARMIVHMGTFQVNDLKLPPATATIVPASVHDMLGSAR